MAGSTSIRQQSLSSKSFPSHDFLIILPYDAVFLNSIVIYTTNGDELRGNMCSTVSVISLSDNVFSCLDYTALNGGNECGMTNQEFCAFHSG
jgi:hypothetical protein